MTLRPETGGRQHSTPAKPPTAFSYVIGHMSIRGWRKKVRGLWRNQGLENLLESVNVVCSALQRRKLHYVSFTWGSIIPRHHFSRYLFFRVA